jgi:hypothetical protein
MLDLINELIINGLICGIGLFPIFVVHQLRGPADQYRGGVAPLIAWQCSWRSWPGNRTPSRSAHHP